MARGLISSTFITILLFFCEDLFSQITYTWNLAGDGNWTTASNWTPARNTPAANDILRFTNGGAKTITKVPNQTIGKLQVTNNTNITLIGANTGNIILTASTAATDAIDVDAGSTLQLRGIRQGANEYSLTLTTANTVGLQANIDGILIATREAVNRPGTIGIFTKGGANATINFNAGSVYTHDVDASLIPLATWNATSTCNIIGLTNTAPSNLNQNFGNFNYDCPDHATLINFNSALTSIAGDFTVKFAGEELESRTLNGLALSSNTSFTLNIGGDLILDHSSTKATWLIVTTGTANVTINISGDFLISNTGVTGSCFFDYKFGTGTAMGTLVINVTGNLTMSGGYLDMGYQASSYSVGAELRLSGNLTVSATSTIITSGVNIINGKIIFNKAGTQTMSEAAAGVTAYVNFQVNSGSTTEFLSSFYLYDYTSPIKSGNFVIQTGGIVDFNTFNLHGYNVASGQINVTNTYTSFILNAGSGIISANTNGVHQIGFTNGSVSAAIATRTFSSDANYTYDAIAVQNSGTFVTTPTANQVNNLTINNSAGVNTTGVTLQQAFAVAGTCTFVNGVFTTTNTNVLTINDNATIVGADPSPGSNKYVNGPLQKIGNDAFVFPVGKQSNGCRWIGISAPSNTTDAFRAELIRGNAGILGTITAPGLDHVSGCEYWYLDRTSGSSSVNVTLSWNGESPCNAMSYVTDLPNLSVAHFNGTNWDAHGNDGGFTGNAFVGSVTWLNVSTFSPFSLGSLLWWTNPLTVKFINLKATERNGQVKLDWANAQETGVQRYFVEHSIDGINFTSVNNTTARNNNSTLTDYSWWHITPVAGINYYRIKAVEYSGEVTYSQVVRLNVDKNTNEFTIYPNPVTGNNIGISASGLSSGKYDILILNMTGQRIMHRSLNHSGGALSMQLNLPQNMKAGLYSIKLSGTDQNFIKTFLIQ